MSVAHEASHGTQGAGVCALQDKVSERVDESSLSACWSAPKHEDEVVATPVQGGDGGIREGFPALAAVAESLMFANRETRVEQEHPLLRPSSQVAALWNGCSRLSLYLLEYILERWRERYAVVHAEAKSVCLSWAVIRVLPEDDHTNFIERCRIESVEDEPSRRIASARSIFLSHELRQRLEVRLVKLLLQLCLPRRFYLYIHVFLICWNKGTIKRAQYKIK